MAQMVQWLLCKCEALSSNPSPIPSPQEYINVDHTFQWSLDIYNLSLHSQVH
jgi:hypothetical protein